MLAHRESVSRADRLLPEKYARAVCQALHMSKTNASLRLCLNYVLKCPDRGKILFVPGLETKRSVGPVPHRKLLQYQWKNKQGLHANLNRLDRNTAYACASAAPLALAQVIALARFLNRASLQRDAVQVAVKNGSGVSGVVGHLGASWWC